MRKNKLLILFFVAVLLFGQIFFSSCTTSANEITVRLTIRAGEEELLDDYISLSYPDPTVLMLISEASMLYEINVVYNDNNDSVKDIEEYKDKTDGNLMYFWEYTINGVLPENTTGGKANAQPIKDGDEIVYMYSVIDTTTVKK